MPKQIHEAPSGPKPLGPYSIITEAHGFVFVSGMIGIDPATGSLSKAERPSRRSR